MGKGEGLLLHGKEVEGRWRWIIDVAGGGDVN